MPKVRAVDASFQRVFSIGNMDDLLPKMTAFKECGASQSPCLAITRTRDNQGFRLAKFETFDGVREEAHQSARIILKCGREEISSFSPVGGQSLPDSPWIFTDNDSSSLVGVGSTRTRLESVIIAVPALALNYTRSQTLLLSS